MWDFDHAPEQERLLERYIIHSSTPSRCAVDLFTGTADIGLIPAAAYAIDPSLLIVPGCAIASRDHIRSILLITREGGPEQAQTVALDTASLTSAAYTEILFRKYWNASAEFVPHAPDLDAMLSTANAALLIGDPALLALEDRAARFTRTGEKLRYLDLGHEWHKRTEVPWVSAFWAVRPDALDRSGVDAAELMADFQSSRDHGLAHVGDLVSEWADRIAVPAATIRTYLTENIHYFLDDASLEGLRVFYRYAAEFSVLPAAPELRLLKSRTH